MTRGLAAVRARIERDPGGALLVLAIGLVVAIYAPTLGRGLVNLDDPWLVADNWIVQDASWASVRTMFFDLSSPRRFVLTPEYLPVRDLSVMLDFAVWGTWYGGHHLTNLVLYVAGLVLWFEALAAFGIERRVAGLCVLLWALHPTHAESVAWVSERKGLLALALAGSTALAYARFRAGGRAAWLGLAAVTAVCTVWGKAPGAFAIAALAGLELTLPARRVRWRRSLVGLGVIGAVGVVAFVPVLMVAREAAVVGDASGAPAGRLAMVIGVHGFYLRAALMTARNAVSYPLSLDGPSALDLVVGAAGLAALLAVALVPGRGWWRPPAEVRAGAVIWLVGWVPVSHLILPLKMVLIADRYVLFPSLGLALIAAAGLARIPRPLPRRALVGAIVVAASLRSFDAQGSWRASHTLWARATEASPRDGRAWASYAEAIERELGAGPEVVQAVLSEGLRHARAPRLLLQQALFLLRRDRVQARALMREAAEGGDSMAMSNLALLQLEDGETAEALRWARTGATFRRNAHAVRTLGKVALAANEPVEALAAFEQAFILEPRSCTNRFNLGLALLAVGRAAEVEAHLAPCVDDPQLGGRVRQLVAQARAGARR